MGMPVDDPAALEQRTIRDQPQTNAGRQWVAREWGDELNHVEAKAHQLVEEERARNLHAQQQIQKMMRVENTRLEMLAKAQQAQQQQ